MLINAMLFQQDFAAANQLDEPVLGSIAPWLTGLWAINRIETNSNRSPKAQHDDSVSVDYS
jgi:hypothetical protein